MKGQKIVLVCMLMCFSAWAMADNVFTEDLSLVIEESDTLSVDEGDELVELDDLDVNASGMPEWLASHFSNDTLFVDCDMM